MDNLAVDKYLTFRKLLDVVSDEYLITGANLSNYAGEIEIEGIDEVGTTITVRVTMKEAKSND